MQDKITPPTPSPIYQDTTPKSSQVSQIPFSKVKDYMEVLSQQERLQFVLKMTKILQHKQIQTHLTLPEGKAPVGQQKIWDEVLSKFQQGKKVHELIEDLEQKYGKGDTQGVSEDLYELTKSFFAQEGETSEMFNKTLIATLKPFLLKKGESEESLKDTLLKQLLSTRSEALKDQGMSDPQIESELRRLLEQFAQAGGKSSFSSSSQVYLESEEEFMDIVHQEGAKKIFEPGQKQGMMALVKDKMNQPDVSEAISKAAGALKEDLAPAQVYNTYRQAIQENWMGTNGTEKLNASMKIELQSLQSLAAILLPKAPKESNIQEIVRMLKSQSSRVDNLSTQDLKDLNQAVQKLLQTYSHAVKNDLVSHSDKMAFRGILGEMCSSLAKRLESDATHFDRLHAQLEKKVKALEGVISGLTHLDSAFTQIQNGSTLSSTSMAHVNESLGNLYLQYGQLTSEQQDHLDEILTKFNDVTLTNGIPLRQAFAEGQGYALVEEFMRLAPAEQSTPAGVKQWLKGQIGVIKEAAKDNPVFLEGISELQKIASAKNFPASQGPLKIPFGSIDDGKFALNSDYWSQFAQTFGQNLSSENIESFRTALSNALPYFEMAYTEGEGEAGGAGYLKSSMYNTQYVMVGATNSNQTSTSSSESLPDEFADIIFNKYMPMQEAYLEELADLLYYSNFGAEMCNILLNDITGWDDCSTDFGFNNWYESMGGNGKVPYDEAHQELNDEYSSAQSYYNQAQKAIDDINNKLNEIDQQEASGQLSPSEADVLRGQLNDDKSQLEAAQGNLTKLMNDINEIGKSMTYDKNGNAVIDSSQMSQLADDEKMVINGDPDNGNYGGLTTISHNIENQESEWSSQSNTEQTQLQEAMTEIQQEWTVVATAMQILNQMYMTCAQAIYK